MDNQASLQALKSIKPVSGHFVADAIHTTYGKVIKKHPTARITFRWIPSHCDVPGNEEADRLAKIAAEEGRDSPGHRLPALLQDKLPLSRSAMEMAMMKELKGEAKKVLRGSKQWGKMKNVDASMPSTRFQKTVVKLTRGQASLLMQLRTGHAPLNAHLHRLKAVDSPVCASCENAYESVHHYLMDCPATQTYRRDLLYVLGRESRSLGTLLSHPRALKPLFKFIARTRRFQDNYGTMELPKPPEKD